MLFGSRSTTRISSTGYIIAFILIDWVFKSFCQYFMLHSDHSV